VLGVSLLLTRLFFQVSFITRGTIARVARVSTVRPAVVTAMPAQRKTETTRECSQTTPIKHTRKKSHRERKKKKKKNEKIRKIFFFSSFSLFHFEATLSSRVSCMCVHVRLRVGCGARVISAR
jgi:hypothetical protein